MKLFGIGAASALTFGAALSALLGKEAVTAEQAEAANTELTAAGLTGAQLITKAAFTDLSEKAGRTEVAESTAQGFTEALTAAGATDVAALVAQRDGYKAKADKFDKLPGAGHTTPSLEAGKTDVDADAPDEHKAAIDNLPHNKALAGHPLFG